jgi:predicted nucleic-acid-binding protein
MVAVDTNIIVRLLTQDDEKQYKKSLDVFKKHEIMILDTVILETEWVLRFAYNFDAVAISGAFTKLFGLPNIHMAKPDVLAQAIKWHLSGMDFADAFHLAQCKNVECLFTFDKKFIKKSKKLSSCEVINP